MVIYNDESTPTVAQQLYNRMLDQDKVDLVLAPFSTFVGGAVVLIVTSHKKLLFNGGFVGIDIFKNAKGSIIGSYTYQGPDYTRGLLDLIKSLPEDKRPKRAAIFTAQNPFPLLVRDGVGGKGGALNFAKEAAIAVPVNEQYPPNTTDFTGLVQKAKAQTPTSCCSSACPTTPCRWPAPLGSRTTSPQCSAPAARKRPRCRPGRSSAAQPRALSARPCRGRANGSPGSPSSRRRSRRAATIRSRPMQSSATPSCR